MVRSRCQHADTSIVPCAMFYAPGMAGLERHTSASPNSPVTLVPSCYPAQPDFCMPSSLMKSTQSREPRKVLAVRTMKDSAVVSL
jgi:hypothetical protein